MRVDCGYDKAVFIYLILIFLSSFYAAPFVWNFLQNLFDHPTHTRAVSETILHHLCRKSHLMKLSCSCVCVCVSLFTSLCLSLSLSLSLSQCVSHCVYVRVRACVCSLFVCVCVCVTQRCYARFNYRDEHPQCETTQSFIARPFFSVGATAMRDRYGRVAVT